MNNQIEMGNDEFILYIRKHYLQCRLTTDQLGKRIFIWLREHAEASKTHEDVRCIWGEGANLVDEMGLPKTATQFKFRRDSLPALYDFLDVLGQE